MFGGGVPKGRSIEKVVGVSVAERRREVDNEGLEEKDRSAVQSRSQGRGQERRGSRDATRDG